MRKIFTLLFLTTFWVFSCTKSIETLPEPTITSISPDIGRLGTLLTITGKDFSNNPADNSVIINGKAITVKTATTTQLTAVIPRAIGTGEVVVESNGRTTRGPRFTYEFVITGVSTIAGSSFGFADGKGSGAKFAYPHTVILDGAGNIIVADSGNNRIRKVTPEGIVTTIAGGDASGYTDGINTIARFSFPTGVAMDTDGGIIVADYANDKIRKINQAGTVSTISGGRTGYADGSAQFAQFSFPTGVVVDADGNIIIVDRANHAIRKIQNGVVSTLAGGDGGGFADAVTSFAKFLYPTAVSIDADKNLIVVDWNNHRIRKINSFGKVTTIAGSGQIGRTDGTALSAMFDYPAGLVIDKAGNMIIADEMNHLIRKISTAGIVTTLGGSTEGSTDGDISSAKFARPTGVVIDASGNIIIADSHSHRIRKIEVE